jgi:cobalt-zinc-cadmium efflux system protein
MASNHVAQHGGRPGLVAQNRLVLAIALSAIILVGELVVGFVANSLALLSDAGHVFTDVVALSLSLFGVRQATRPANSRMTFGYHRIGIVVALINAALIAFIAAVILWESYQRLRDPQEVRSLLMLGMAAVGLAANLVVVFWLRGHARHSLNIRSAFFHAGGDALASVGVITGGLIIYFTDWFWLDPVIGILIACIILVAAWGIAREAVAIIVEASPRHLDQDELVGTIRSLPGVHDVHDLHVWSLSSQLHALSCHVQVDDSLLSQRSTLLNTLRDLLQERYNICHTTIQLECPGCENHALYCEIGSGAPNPDRSKPHASDHVTREEP